MLKRIGCLLLATLFVGCSGDASSTEAVTDTGSGEGSAAGSGDGSGSGAPFEMPADVRPSSGCGKRSYGPGVNKLQLTFGGLTRKYDLVLPDSYDDRLPLPMVMNLHPLVLGGPLHSIWTSQSALNAKGNAEMANSWLLRAEADAELAVALSRADAEKTEAQAAVERVRKLQSENPYSPGRAQ